MQFCDSYYIVGGFWVTWDPLYIIENADKMYDCWPYAVSLIYMSWWILLDEAESGCGLFYHIILTLSYNDWGKVQKSLWRKEENNNLTFVRFAQ
jgi:hypothetical protein